MLAVGRHLGQRRHYVAEENRTFTTAGCIASRANPNWVSGQVAQPIP